MSFVLPTTAEKAAKAALDRSNFLMAVQNLKAALDLASATTRADASCSDDVFVQTARDYMAALGLTL
jgi:hypothetical protein